jgi:L-threonylcarbamoyladenylate synthase
MSPTLTNPLVQLDEAAAILTAGGVVAFPTETVYGLGAAADDSDAVLKVYEIKGRPRFNPLIVHCVDLAMAERLVVFSPLARQLAERLWPGPLSLVLPRRGDAAVSDLVTAGLSTLAVRVPAHAMARALIEAVGRPLAAPSANPSGKLSPTTAAQVIAGFGGTVPVLDGGPCEAGLESTILAIDRDRVVQLRAGAVAREEIETVLGRPVPQAEAGPVIAPGMLASHYAPRAMLRLAADRPEAGEAWLGFGTDPAYVPPQSLNLSPTGDLREAARNLFSYLARLDESGMPRIAVAPIPATGLGEAITDRLNRAAAPR